jgi:hypothetical protein
MPSISFAILSQCWLNDWLRSNTAHNQNAQLLSESSEQVPLALHFHLLQGSAQTGQVLLVLHFGLPIHRSGRLLVLRVGVGDLRLQPIQLELGFAEFQFARGELLLQAVAGLDLLLDGLLEVLNLCLRLGQRTGAHTPTAKDPACASSATAAAAVAECLLTDGRSHGMLASLRYPLKHKDNHVKHHTSNQRRRTQYVVPALCGRLHRGRCCRLP